MTHTFVFAAPAGQRLLRRGDSVRCFTTKLWWVKETRQWRPIDHPEAARYGCSTHAPCRTFKAFKRHLRRHADVFAGHEVHFVSRYEDGMVTAVPIESIAP